MAVRGGGEQPDGRRVAGLVVVVALGLQAGLLGLAVLIGIREAPERAPARVEVDSGATQAAAERRVERERDLAELDRRAGAALAELAAELPEVGELEVVVEQPELAEVTGALGALLPVGEAFGGSRGQLALEMGEAELAGPDPVEFLGQEFRAQRLVLAFDVSGSVKTKMERAGTSLEALREEVLALLEQLGPNHLFGMVQFTRKWLVFRKELVPATTAMKAEARRWMEEDFRTSGTSGRNWSGGRLNGIEAVLEAAFGMDARLDEVLLVSDGDFQRTPAGGGGQDVPWPELRRHTRELREAGAGDGRLRVLAFYPEPASLPKLRAWVGETGGSLEVRR